VIVKDLIDQELASKGGDSYRRLSTAEQMAVDLRILKKLRQKEKELDQQLRELQDDDGSNNGCRVATSSGMRKTAD
jgi:hypothetical protein